MGQMKVKGLTIAILKKLNVLLVMIFSILLFSGCEPERGNRQIESVEVYSIDWDVFSGYRYDTKNVVKSTKHKVRIIKSTDTI